MTSPPGPPLSLRLVWLSVLLAHVALAGFALWSLPHGFPALHPRSVLGLWAPLCIVVGPVALGVALLFTPRAGARFVPALPTFWASLALGLILVFPLTGPVAARSLGEVALFLAVLAFVTCRRSAVRELLPAILLGAAAGQLVARCERPSPPSTHPSFESPPRRADGSGTSPDDRFEIGSDLTVESATQRVTWRTPQITISIAPLLEFDRMSPDGFWSIFTPNREPTTSSVTGVASENALQLWAADGAPRLHVERGERILRLEAWTVLDAARYSHLNSYTTVEVTGHRKLALRFSACPATLIAVTHADYPSGAPARFAYVDAARTLHVVQATDAEKGPFVSLAQGLLPADRTLQVDLVETSDRDHEHSLASLEFLDFAAEASTALSPTAGYGVPENAIQFGLAEADASSPAHLMLSLAASGIGRGWDSVGHRAGAYLNRMQLRSFEPLPGPELGPPLNEAGKRACAEIAKDIADAMPRFAQLAEFGATRVNVQYYECSIDYAYHTHRSTVRAGWAAQVPAPDPDGLWFHVGIWNPEGMGRTSQINTQAGYSTFAFADNNLTVLIRDGHKKGEFESELRSILKRHGLGKLLY